MTLHYLDGSSVETDVPPDVLYILARAVREKHAKVWIKATRGSSHESHVGLGGVDFERTFSPQLTAAFEAA